ncbi:MAG: DUF177 domain-containing protein [Flavobacteriaceae bacterium]|nr:DUF177 domain-containing protein [Flavobacteriaceae bacterium]
MHFLNQFVINFAGLKLGVHEFKFDLDNSFFEHFDYNDFNSCNISTKILLNKKSNLLELNFFSKGSINLNCHVSNEPFDFSQKNEMNLVVKFSSEKICDNEEFLVLPNGVSQINVSHYLYEMIILSLPIKIIHPGVENGTLESETLNALRRYEKNVHRQNKKTDPRWDKLKDLI